MSFLGYKCCAKQLFKPLEVVLKMAKTYEEMLKRAYDKMPAIVFEQKRFEVPKAKVTVEGKKSIWANAQEIAGYISRDLHSISKTISKDLGASFKVEGTRVVFVGKFSQSLVQTKLDDYIKAYVICPVCGKPDSRLEKTDRVQVLRCLACGASSAVK